MKRQIEYNEIPERDEPRLSRLAFAEWALLLRCRNRAGEHDVGARVLILGSHRKAANVLGKEKREQVIELGVLAGLRGGRNNRKEDAPRKG